MSRRRTRALPAVIAALALLVAACGDDDDDDAGAAGGGGSTTATTVGGAPETTAAAGATASTGTSSGDPGDDACTPERRGGDLTMALFQFPPGLDPTRTPGGSGSSGAIEMGAVYDTLLRWDTEAQEFVPHLAESFEANAERTEWTVTLREGVTFGNGDPLDAQAVLDSVERIGPASYQAGYVKGLLIDEVVAPDPLTVVFRLSQGWGGFPVFLASEGGMIVNARIAAERGDDFGANPQGAGAGPYEVVRFAPGEEIVMEARDDYWGGPVCLDELRFISVVGGTATYEAFLQGEADMAYFTEPRVGVQAIEDGNDSYRSVVGLGGGLFINQRPGDPGADVRVRQAIVHALDLDTLNDRVYDGTGLTTAAVVHPDSPLSPGVPGPAYDPELARQLVEEAKAAGWDGSIDLLCGNEPVQTDLSIIFEGMLEAVGMDVSVERLGVGDRIPRIVIDKNYELACLGTQVDEAVNWPTLGRQLLGGPPSWTGYQDAEMSARVDELRLATTLDEQRAAMGRIQERWNETVPSAVFENRPDVVIWSERVHGLVFSRSTQVMFQGVYVDG